MPDKEALVYAYPEQCLEIRLNFREYRDQVDRVARGLLALGIGQGEHVAIWAPNLPEWIFLQLALYRIDPGDSVSLHHDRRLHRYG